MIPTASSAPLPSVVSAVRDCLREEVGLSMPAYDHSSPASASIAALGDIASSILQSPLLLGAFAHYGVAPTASNAYRDMSAFWSDAATWDLGLVVRPFKTSVRDLVDDVSPSAALAGSIDTIIRLGSRRVGVNANVWGIVASLQMLSGCASEIVVILGAGSSARSAVLAVRHRWPSVRVYLAARNEAVAANTAREVKVEAISPAALSGLPVGLLINATSWGDTQDSELMPFELPFTELLAVGSSFLDVNIRRSSLQDQALARGCAVVSGVVMQTVTQLCRAALVRSVCDTRQH